MEKIKTLDGHTLTIYVFNTFCGSAHVFVDDYREDRNVQCIRSKDELAVLRSEAKHANLKDILFSFGWTIKDMFGNTIRF